MRKRARQSNATNRCLTASNLTSINPTAWQLCTIRSNRNCPVGNYNRKNPSNMKPYSRSIFDLFDGKRRYEVPLFQRQYVWNLEDHWEPLWEDIERKFVQRLNGAASTPHFLGVR